MRVGGVALRTVEARKAAEEQRHREVTKLQNWQREQDPKVRGERKPGTSFLDHGVSAPRAIFAP